MVGLELDDRVEGPDGIEEVGHEVSRIDRRKLEDVAEQNDLGELTALQETVEQLREELKLDLRCEE